MATAGSTEGDPGESSAAGRKRRRDYGIKLLIGEKVEVRLSDEGLKGSWHRAVVIKCEKGLRWVRYEEIFADDNVTKLVEPIKVSGAADGFRLKSKKKYRGWIRPLPPVENGEGMEVTYGLCVDCLLNDAWWEGVVFDREEGSSQRLVFFPDQGDRHLVNVDQMRYSYDWNEASGNWQLRGGWSFLKLLRKLEEKGPFPISIREIWYDVSCTDAYHQKIGEWVSGSWCTWCHLVTLAINEALSVSLGQCVNGEDIFLHNHTDNPDINDIKTDTLDTQFGDSTATVMNGVDQFLGNASPNLAKRKRTNTLQSKFHLKFQKMHFKNSNKMKKCDNSEDTVRSLHTLREYSTDISVIKQTMFSLAAHCRSGGKSLRGSKIFRHNAKRYLLSMGWRIKKLPSGPEKYVSPKGKVYTSLVTAFLVCSKRGVYFKSSIPDCKTNSVTCNQPYNSRGSIPDCKKNLVTGNQPYNLRGKLKNQDDGLMIVSGDLKNWYPVVIEAEYCPETVVTYAEFLKKGMCILKSEVSPDFNVETARSALKRHIVALGWKILRKEEKRKIRYLYISPEGTKFRSLQTLVPFLIETDQYWLAGDPHGREAQCFSHLPCSMNASSREAFDTEHVVPENCPEVLLAYINCMESKNDNFQTLSKEQVDAIRVKALEYLQDMGWSFYYVKKGKGSQRQYRSPNCKLFVSLLKACKASLEDLGVDTANKDTAANDFGHLPIDHMHRLRIKFHTSAQGNLTQGHRQFSDARSDIDFVYHKLQRKGVKKSGINGTSVAPAAFEFSHDSQSKIFSKPAPGKKKTKKRKVSVTPNKGLSYPNSDVSDVRLSKQGHAVASFPSQHTPRTVLSWLIGNGAISPRQKVKYLRKRDGHVLMEGRITHGGIKCKCCKKVLTLTNFEAHAGSTNHRPCANIFLQDGRSLLDCQRQLLEREKPKNFPHKRIKSDYSVYPSDAICSICQEGGTLVLCDHCPSSFHLRCVGLEVVPEGKWFCPSCKCSICGLGEFNSDCDNFTRQTKLFCDQCEREYHVGCLQDVGLSSLTRCPEGYWFCTKTCSEIFWHLRMLVGRPHIIASGDYSWTILRAKRENDLDFSTLDKEASTEEHSKLRVALDVLHECFVTIIEPRTKTDLVADLLHNKESELNRLNFWGFYTMLLEKGDEVVSVATFRVYGDKVAEMPLVGTRIKYRRKGMCRLLINALEKLLSSMGVERFLLPAVPELLETWTRSFGFTVMTDSDKIMLSRYTFLNFQSTTMCQKFLASTDKTSGQLSGKEQVEKMVNIDGIEANRTKHSGITETVPRITFRRTVTTDSHALPSANGGTFPIVSSCSNDACAMQEDKDPCLRKDETSLNIVPARFDGNCKLVGSGSTMLGVESAREVNCEGEGELSESHFGNDMNGFLVKSSDTFRYFYKRRVLAN